MKTFRLIILALMAGLAAKAGAALNATANVSPFGASQGQIVTVILQVNNSSANAVTSVSSSLNVSMGTAVQMGGPSSQGVTITAGSSANFVYTFSVSGCGAALAFSGSAQGSELGAPVLSNQASTTAFTPACLTATPTPAPILVAPTEIPGKSDAKVLGNKFHPGAGRTIGFKVTLPYGGSYRISIYDRQGQKLKFIDREGIAGDNLEFWNGRSDQGAYLSTGIYAVHFNGKGLDRVAKIVVIK